MGGGRRDAAIKAQGVTGDRGRPDIGRGGGVRPFGTRLWERKVPLLKATVKDRVRL